MFYENFERLCKAKGMPMSRVAKEAGFNHSTPGYWKSSGIMPKDESLESLAQVLGCDVSEFRLTEEDLAKRTLGIDALTDEEMEVAKLYRKLPKSDQLRIMAELLERAQ